MDKIPTDIDFIVILVNAFKDNTNFEDVESALKAAFPQGQSEPRVLSDVSIGCRGNNEGLIWLLLKEVK